MLGNLFQDGSVVTATLAYAGLSQHFPNSYAARASTAINLICFLMAFIAQYAIGFIMQIVEPGKQSGYSIKAYQAGFGLFLGLLIINGGRKLIWQRT